MLKMRAWRSKETEGVFTLEKGVFMLGLPRTSSSGKAETADAVCGSMGLVLGLTRTNTHMTTFTRQPHVNGAVLFT